MPLPRSSPTVPPSSCADGLPRHHHEDTRGAGPRAYRGHTPSSMASRRQQLPPGPNHFHHLVRPSQAHGDSERLHVISSEAEKSEPAIGGRGVINATSPVWRRVTTRQPDFIHSGRGTATVTAIGRTSGPSVSRSLTPCPWLCRGKRRPTQNIIGVVLDG